MYETVTGLKYLGLHRWRMDDQLTKFVVCMLLSGMIASIGAGFEYGIEHAATMLLWWGGVVWISSAIISRWML